MDESKPLAAFFLFFFIWGFILSGSIAGEMAAFNVSNKCPFPIWPATASNAGQPEIEGGSFFLPSGQTHRIHVPSAWTGRLWARTGCDFNSGTKPACQTGDCDGRLECNGIIGLPPATLVQVALQADKSKLSFYDVSLVDGYNLPVSVNTWPGAPGCSIGGCTKNINSACPLELRVLDRSGAVVACKSACLAFNLDVFCCRNAYGTPDKCKPTLYSKMFKDKCPSYYSYAYDSPPPLVSCSSKEFVITFCPSKWGDHQSM
ncbi:hypothetical protein MRB53_006830 [Persea americana]|uniref:Uncharacterized protein n=1 Tax=Persea americana TaxID=3435 RepID=A0ACC2MH94_PERAE|nr:hypothetical protein MRB53_006830 [Persea americana]